VVAKHRAENADITVVSHPIPADKVGAVGILKIDPATGACLARQRQQHSCEPVRGALAQPHKFTGRRDGGAADKQ